MILKNPNQKVPNSTRKWDITNSDAQKVMTEIILSSHSLEYLMPIKANVNSLVIW